MELIQTILLLLGAALLAGIWFAVRAACRKLGMRQKPEILTASALCLTPFIVLLVSSLDTLDDLEKACRSELLKTQRMADTSSFLVLQHYDFWTKTVSGGGMAIPWISHPYKTAKVSLVVQFKRDHQPHQAWIDCIFSKLPDTGDPPQVILQKVEFSWENVLKPISDSSYTWVPWHPSALGDAVIGK
jgi:hypothetical protein